MKYTGDTRVTRCFLSFVLISLICASSCMRLHAHACPSGGDMYGLADIADNPKGEDDPGPGKTGDRKDKDPPGYKIENLPPLSSRGKSLSTAIALDLLVPGGGHFYRGDYYFGTAFLLLKAAGAWSIYYYYHEREYYGSLYRAAVKADRIDPYHDLYFIDEEGNYKSVRDYRHDYDRAAQMITFAVIANIALYAASLIVNYYSLQNTREKTIPAFEIYTFAGVSGGAEPCIALSCAIRM